MYNVEEKVTKWSKNHNLILRKIEGKKGEVYILYVKQLTNTDMLARTVIKPMLKFLNGEEKIKSSQHIAYGILTCEDLRISENEDKIVNEVLNGMCALLAEGIAPIIINLKAVIRTSPSEADINYSILGAKDSFTENIDSNLSLIRYRVKDKNLKLDTMQIGRRTKTGVLIGYIKDIADDKYVRLIKERLSKIDIDGINEAGKLLWFLNDKPYSVFPQAGMEQRSDVACSAMLDGKIIVLCEGSGIALVLPKVFSEFIFSGEEEYENIYFTLFSRLIRISAIIISLFITPFYIATMLHHGEAIKTSYAIVLASGRAGVVFNVVAEAFIMEAFVEILREALMRAPKSIGSSIGIVGGIVVGSAIVEAKIFSPVILIIVSLSLLSSFVMADVSMANSFRIIKILFMLTSWIFGIPGLVCAGFLMLISIIDDTSLKTPYMAPFAPFNFYDSIQKLYTNKRLSFFRMSYLNTKAKIKRKI